MLRTPKKRQPEILKGPNGTWIHLGGQTFHFKDKDTKTSRRQGQAANSGGEIIYSPMPGKVLKVNFSAGEAVKKGETVCVIEAMKMEYPLKAPKDGKIKKVFKKQGDLVALDDQLLELDFS